MLLSPLPVISSWLIQVSVLFIFLKNSVLMHIFHVGELFCHPGSIILMESFDVTIASAGWASSYSRRSDL